jgi:hypothetical protein
MSPRIAALDIETAPAKVYTFQLDKPYITLDQVIEPSRMICFAAQFSDRRTKPVEFYAEWKSDGGHEAMVRQAWRVADEADILLHFNGKRFDTPWLRTEFARLGLKPPAPFHEIDLYQQTRQFFLMSHKLQHVSTHLVDSGGKLHHSGFQLWRDVLDGDPKAQRLMERYNRRDVTALWDVFDELKPWLKIPNAGLYGAPVGACPRCESTNVQRRGLKALLTGVYQQYQCQDCGGWFRSSHRTTAVDSVEVAA